MEIRYNVGDRITVPITGTVHRVTITNKDPDGPLFEIDIDKDSTGRTTRVYLSEKDISVIEDGLKNG